MPSEFFDQEDGFGQGGITYQLDHHLRALQHATWLDDPRRYANLACQLAAILRPKLEPDEFNRLSEVEISTKKLVGLSRREARREYERLLFRAARNNVAELLYIVSRRGIYAKLDESPSPPADASGMALK